MKKSTKSVLTATTPATPALSPATKATAKKKTSKAAAAPAPAPQVKTSTAAGSATTIVAHLDVGFGNTLYIRGEGPGLSWEAGVPLDCVADDRWQISLPETSKPIVFKLLLNDITWCGGDDFVAQPGTTVTVIPIF